MSCPSCFLPQAALNYLCQACSQPMCDECATFAPRCNTVVCYECSHDCGDPQCTDRLLIHMTVGDLLRVYAGETFLYQHWERIGNTFLPETLRILPDLSIQPLTDANPFSFPEILSVRVYAESHAKLAKTLWTRIRLVNSVPDSLSSYLTKIGMLSDQDFILWYHHRHHTRDHSFEDRVFSPNHEMLRRLKEPGGASLVPHVKEMLKNDTGEEYHIPK